MSESRAGKSEGDRPPSGESCSPEVLFIGPFLAPLIEHLEPGVTVHRLWEAEDREEFLASIAPRIRAAATDAFTGADRALMESLPNLELIANFGVGYELIDVDCATERGVTVTNTPGVLDEDVADLAMGLLLATCRRIPQGHRFVQEGKWQEGMFPLATRLSGKRLGIVGLGRIGKALARRAEGFGLDIAYHGRHEQVDQPYRYYPELVALARDVDLLVALVPANAETEKLIGREALEALAENDGIFVNVARGSVVDEAALVELLVDGRLGGAGLDVFANEPHVPEALLELDNVVLQPHVGSATRETRQAMGRLVLENLLACLRGDPLPTPVNRPEQ